VRTNAALLIADCGADAAPCLAKVMALPESLVSLSGRSALAQRSLAKAAITRLSNDFPEAERAALDGLSSADDKQVREWLIGLQVCQTLTEPIRAKLDEIYRTRSPGVAGEAARWRLDRRNFSEAIKEGAIRDSAGPGERRAAGLQALVYVSSDRAVL